MPGLQQQLREHSWLDKTQCLVLGTTGQAAHRDAQVPSPENRECEPSREFQKSVPESGVAFWLL